MPVISLAQTTANPVQASSQLIESELQRLDECIRSWLSSNVVLVRQIAEYIIASGGKRLRPKLHLLAARACGYEGDKHILLAAVIEFIHTATLLHDDVVDESDMRRGRETAHKRWGNPASVLVGDFLYSRSFQMMVEVGDMRVMEILADTTNIIAEGEVMQLLNMRNPEITEADYLAVIEHKTARLFQAACELGGLLAGVPPELRQALRDYGRELGAAFQIMDDVLDYSAEQEVLGKKLGDDLAEGKPTLPIIFARQRASDSERAILDEIILNGGDGRMAEVMTILKRTDALPLARQRAQEIADKAESALVSLPSSKYRDALIALCRYSVARDH
ncbi:MAG: polyprenyl synthetase family protein [Xanthomonadales bacterium]|jgi:octaprenyl-diphosphate synthase|nr:polyprenyl synthetase family protein [Xanthomonadales bacterium]